jgi:hypothetical protein
LLLELIGDYRNEIIVCYLIAGIGSVCYASSVREINLFLASKKIEGVPGPDEPVAYKQHGPTVIAMLASAFALFIIWPVFLPLIILIQPVPDARLIAQFLRLTDQYRVAWNRCNYEVRRLREVDINNCKDELDFLSQYKLILGNARILDSYITSIYENILKLADRGDGSLIDLTEINNYGWTRDDAEDWSVLAEHEFACCILRENDVSGSTKFIEISDIFLMVREHIILN